VWGRHQQIVKEHRRKHKICDVSEF